MGRAELAEELKAQGIRATLAKHKITEEYLVEKLKEELNASKIEKSKSKTGKVSRKKVALWDVRQRARMDAHKLRGDYPADKVEHSGSISIADRVREARERTGKQ